MDRERWLTVLNGFFNSVFGRTHKTGYVCIALLEPGKRELHEHFFEWPARADKMKAFIVDSTEGYNVYFCPQLLSSRRRKKETVTACPAAWADLDDCQPHELLVPPTVLIETSLGRHQALWVFESEVTPEAAEEVSRRIAYYHAESGADKSGWDLTQLLRVPGTRNLKNPDTQLFVDLKKINRTAYRLEDFNAYPESQLTPKAHIPIPKENELPTQEPLDLLQARRDKMHPGIFDLYSREPELGEFKEGWSGALWKLIMYMFEAGFERNEVFYVCKTAACNKYIRDGRPPEELWNDVCRGYFKYQERINTVFIPELTIRTDLLSAEEEESVRGKETFVDRYIKWASGLGDAAGQYHQAGAFIILSALLAGKVVLPTSFGNVVPNLWFMILADTTITRKSTAMDIATDLLIEVDPEAIMATDGSIEGLLTGLSTRPGRASIFLRDEFSGLLESMTKKDYMAGMAETLTKLYDGKFSKRMLRKEIIEIREPVLILFAGGIRNRVQQLLTLDHVSSGFMPRFVYITAESDVSRVRPMGPPVQVDLAGREALIDEMQDILLHYSQLQAPIRGFRVGSQPKASAHLTPQAWARYNKFETEMLQAGIASERADILTPVYDRLGKSILKASVLLASAESRKNEVTVEETHILQAIHYGRSWRDYAIEVIEGVGKTAHERDLERILAYIKKRPGVSRSSLMQQFHLTAQSAAALFNTLEQRGLVYTNTHGRGQCFWTPDHKEAVGASADQS